MATTINYREEGQEHCEFCAERPTRMFKAQLQPIAIQFEDRKYVATKPYWVMCDFCARSIKKETTNVELDRLRPRRPCGKPRRDQPDRKAAATAVSGTRRLGRREVWRTIQRRRAQLEGARRVQSRQKLGLCESGLQSGRSRKNFRQPYSCTRIAT